MVYFQISKSFAHHFVSKKNSPFLCPICWSPSTTPCTSCTCAAARYAVLKAALVAPVTDGFSPFPMPRMEKNDSKKDTLQGINISHLGKRNIIFKMTFFGGYVSFLEGNTMISNMIILNRQINFLISMAHTVKVMAAQLEYLLELQRLIKMPWIGLTFMNLKVLKFEDEIIRKISLRKTKTYFWYDAHDEIKVPTPIISVSSLRQLPLQWSSLKDERAVSRRPPYHRPTPRQTHLRWIWFHGYFRSSNTKCNAWFELLSWKDFSKLPKLLSNTRSDLGF